jgi:hypothetical protein
MKSSKFVLPIIIGLVAIVSVLFMFGSKAKPKNYPQTAVDNPTSLKTKVESSVQPTATPSKYSAEFKAKVRASFIANCDSRGHYGVPVCTCTAEYLSNNYSEEQLAKFYVEYYTEGKTPEEIKSAINTCSNK